MAAHLRAGRPLTEFDKVYTISGGNVLKGSTLEEPWRIAKGREEPVGGAELRVVAPTQFARLQGPSRTVHSDPGRRDIQHRCRDGV